MVSPLPTRAGLFSRGAEEILARSELRPPGQRFSREAIYTEGTDLNIILAAASAMGDEVTRALAERIAALYLDSAEGEDLDRLVTDRFSPTIVRKQPSSAVAVLSFSRSSGSFAGVSMNIGSRFRTTRGTEFELSQVMALPAGSSGPVTAQARAVQAGSAGNAAVGTITQFVTTPPDPALVVTNLEPAAGGAEGETDAALRARARDFFRTARRGTLGAIEFGALTVGGVVRATAIENTDPFGVPDGRVDLFIADTAGNANQALVNAVNVALMEYRGAGVWVRTVAGVPVFVPIQLRLRYRSNVDTAAAWQSVVFLLTSAINTLGPGQTLERSLIMSLCRQVYGVIVLDDAVASPAGDLVPTAGQSIKTSADLITAV
jgi:uncharacterized phage protein gp47/JayE